MFYKIHKSEELHHMQSIVPAQNRFEVGFQLLNKWLMLRQQGKTLEKYFADNMLKSIAIYGMGALGERLLQELATTDVKVEYAIDRMADSKRGLGIAVYHTDSNSFQDVDAIVVTPVQDYWNIVEGLAAKTDIPVLSLEDVVEYCL